MWSRNWAKVIDIALNSIGSSWVTHRLSYTLKYFHSGLEKEKANVSSALHLINRLDFGGPGSSKIWLWMWIWSIPILLTQPTQRREGSSGFPQATHTQKWSSLQRSEIQSDMRICEQHNFSEAIGGKFYFAINPSYSYSFFLKNKTKKQFNNFQKGRRCLLFWFFNFAAP